MEKVAVSVKAGTLPTRQDKDPPGQRSARTKIELCNDIGKSTFPYGKTTGHTDIRQLTGQHQTVWTSARLPYLCELYIYVSSFVAKSTLLTLNDPRR